VKNLFVRLNEFVFPSFWGKVLVLNLFKSSIAPDRHQAQIEQCLDEEEVEESIESLHRTDAL
jgi:hypothetical protein